MSMTDQLLLESAWRIIHFAWEDHQDEAVRMSLEPYIAGDAVAIDVWHMRTEVLMRFIVACSAERLVPSIQGLVASHRFLLRPHTASANPVLDLMNEYEVWKQQQRRR